MLFHTPLKKKTLLVVEDDKSSRLLIKYLLQNMNIEVIDAETGEEALKLIKGKKVEGMLLDIALGSGITGLELGEKIKAKARFKHTPMVAITAYEKRVLGNFKEKGFTGYLQKPYSVDQLQGLLDSQSLRKKGNRLLL